MKGVRSLDVRWRASRRAKPPSSPSHCNRQARFNRLTSVFCATDPAGTRENGREVCGVAKTPQLAEGWRFRALWASLTDSAPQDELGLIRQDWRVKAGKLRIRARQLLKESATAKGGALNVCLGAP
jgi:hypothetical protein